MQTNKSQLHVATATTCLACLGFNFVPVDMARLVDFKARAYASSIQYLWAGKDPNVGSGAIDFKAGIDCSGWFRTLVNYITHGILDPGDGSYNQGHDLIDLGFRHFSIGSESEYLDHATANDNLFRVGFHWPNGRNGDSVGHVFPIMHDHTSESYGGHGPGERPAEHSWFLQHCDLIVVIGPMLEVNQWTNKVLNPYA